MDTNGHILIVDDDRLVLRSLKQVFMDDYDVTTVSSGSEALDILAKNTSIDAIVLDIKMAKMDGLETARCIKKLNSQMPIIFCTGFPGEYSEDEIDSDHKPFDYISKQEGTTRLQRTVRNAVRMYQLKQKGTDLVTLAQNEYGMVGSSKAMLNVYRMIEQVAPTDSKVMILGPTGTGKELVARGIHKQSRRSDERLAIFNCNHKQPDLVESELFGHVKGAFTGAIEDRIGLFQYADNGTVFLDEIGDLDITTQAKLLRVLETGEMQRIGSAEVAQVDVRLMCATHRDLPEMIAEDRFREDLYYRLKGIVIEVPPLSQRREDIPALVEFVSDRYCQDCGAGIKLFDPSCIDLMIDYNWPGNVRQLADTVQSLIDLAGSSYISADDVSTYLNLDQPSQSNGSLSQQVLEFKKSTIVKALHHHNNNVSAAARELDVNPANLHRMIKGFGINDL